MSVKQAENQTINPGRENGQSILTARMTNIAIKTNGLRKNSCTQYETEQNYALATRPPEAIREEKRKHPQQGTLWETRPTS